MEPAHLIAIAGSIGTLLASAIGILYRAESLSRQEQIIEIKKTIEYERLQKENALKYNTNQNRDVLKTMNDLIHAIDGIGPLVTGDGSKTRHHVSEQAHEIIKGIKL